jgi:hypothetical protein
MNFIGTGTKLTKKDYEDAAAKLGIPYSRLRGTADVESAGSGFDNKNRPKILFEPHVFYARLPAGAKRDQAVARHLAYKKWGSLPYPKTSEENYRRLIDAMLIDRTAALESASWGLFQIMGYNCHDAGYATVAALVQDFMSGERAQLAAFSHIVQRWGIADELKRGDAAGFARRYNGAGFAKNHYDTKLLARWAHYETAAQRMHFASLTEGADGGVDPSTRGPDASVASPVQDASFAGDPITSEPPEDNLFDPPASEAGSAPDTVEAAPSAEKPKEPAKSDIVADSQSTPELQAKLAEARKDVPDAEIVKNSTIAQQAQDGIVAATRKKIAAASGALISFMAVIFNAISDKFADAKAALAPIFDTFSSVPGWLYFVIMTGFSYLLYVSFHREERRNKVVLDKRIEMTKTGQTL